jgi:hypothetical protein
LTEQYIRNKEKIAYLATFLGVSGSFIFGMTQALINSCFRNRELALAMARLSVKYAQTGHCQC